MLRVNLKYFRDTGKYCGEGTYKSDKKYVFDIWKEVKQMRNENCLPNINDCDVIVLVDVPGSDCDQPRLIF